MDEAGLCGPGLPFKPIALPASVESGQGWKIPYDGWNLNPSFWPAFQSTHYYTMGARGGGGAGSHIFVFLFWWLTQKWLSFTSFTCATFFLSFSNYKWMHAGVVAEDSPFGACKLNTHIHTHTQTAKKKKKKRSLIFFSSILTIICQPLFKQHLIPSK